MKNKEIAKQFYEIADFLEMQDVEWKPRAYGRAARSIESLSDPVEEFYEEINSYANENDIDLIKIGTHGRSDLDRLLLGSVTEKVIRTSKKPVLTVGREDWWRE